MTTASLLIPKISARYLTDTCPFETAVQKMREYKYTAVPVISGDGNYVSTVSEGDFLWYILENGDENLKNICVRNIIKKEKNPPVRITATIDELYERAMSQNFIPIIDDRGFFMGIVTRRRILEHIRGIS